MKFLVEKGFYYERSGTLEMKIIKDIQFVGAMLPPSGDVKDIDPRFLSLYSIFALIPPNQENLERIYKSILEAHVKQFQIMEIEAQVSKITQGTLKLYQAIMSELSRTPIKFHYVFNLRDLSRIYEGLCRSTVDKFDTKEKFVRLWRNECERVFKDRLITESDR